MDTQVSIGEVSVVKVSKSLDQQESEMYFEDFWYKYPKKVGKDAARKSFDKRKPTEELLRMMLTAIDQQSTSQQWTRDGGQFIPNPATWLNQGRWQDNTIDEQPNPFAGGI
jgi:hypothetical protein